MVALALHSYLVPAKSKGALSKSCAKVVLMILDMAAQQFSITLSTCVRLARQDDLRRLEWFGMLTPFREILEKDFERAEQGELVYLVAEANSYPIGQVEVDLTKKGDLGIGVLMALRMLPPFQNLGIGSQLLQAAEQAIRDHHLQIAELGVAKDNPGAFRLYVRQVTSQYFGAVAGLLTEPPAGTVGDRPEPPQVIEKIRVTRVKIGRVR
jgi:ribosomal protein S18 acetylase RimI-like enzyme